MIQPAPHPPVCSTRLAPKGLRVHLHDTTYGRGGPLLSSGGTAAVRLLDTYHAGFVLGMGLCGNIRSVVFGVKVLLSAHA